MLQSLCKKWQSYKFHNQCSTSQKNSSHTPIDSIWVLLKSHAFALSALENVQLCSSQESKPYIIEINRYFTIIGYRFWKKMITVFFFISHIHNYTEYNQQWNVFSAFDPSKCTHTLGAVDTHTQWTLFTHTHQEQWTLFTHTQTHLEQWRHTHTHTHTHTWSSGDRDTHTHTPGAVETHTHTHTKWTLFTHTHLEQWRHTHTHTHLEQWRHTHIHTQSGHCSLTHTRSSGHCSLTHTHKHTWSSGDTHTHTWSSGHCSPHVTFIQDSLVWNTLNYINIYYRTIISPINISIEINYLLSPQAIAVWV